MRLALEAGSATLELATKHRLAGVAIDAASLEDGVTVNQLTESGLAAAQIGVPMFNPLNDDAAALDTETRRLGRAIERCGEVHARHIMIGPGNHHSSGFAHWDPRNDSEESLDQYARALEPFRADAERREVNICVEPYLKGVINSPERFRDLKRRLPSAALRCNIDPTSLYQFRDAMDSRDVITRVTRKLADYVGRIHVKEVALAPGFHIHLGLVPLGEGCTDWAELLRMLGDAVPCETWVLLEHIADADECERSMAILRSAAAEANVTLT